MVELIFRNIESMFSFFISVSKINWLSHSLIAYGYLTDKNDKKYLFIILLSKHREVLMYVQCTYYVWRTLNMTHFMNNIGIYLCRHRDIIDVRLQRQLGLASWAKVP